jgi:riboflavin transporter FmnP
VLPIAVLARSRRLAVRIAAVVSATLVMTVVMAAVNLLVDPWYFKMPVAAVKAMIATAIIPFNLLRGLINSVASLGILAVLDRSTFLKPLR